MFESWFYFVLLWIFLFGVLLGDILVKSVGKSGTYGRRRSLPMIAFSSCKVCDVSLVLFSIKFDICE